MFQTLIFFSEVEETYRSTLGKYFRIRFAKLDTFHVVQVFSLEEAQNKKIWESFHLEIQILVILGKGKSSEQTW
jgi:hypothetical protein